MSDKHYTHHDDRTHLEDALRRTKPWFEANATFLIYGLAAVLAIAAAIVWVQRQPSANSEVSALIMQARSPEDYQNIADSFSETELGSLARLKQAEALLNSASGKMFQDREAAGLELEQAEAALNRLGDASAGDATISERVLIGKARLTELQCDGTEESIQAAIAAWQLILDQNPEAMAKPLAEQRIARLQKPDAKQFYAWFNELDPQPIDNLLQPGLPGASGGPGSSVPAVPQLPPGLTLPAMPDVNLDAVESESDESAAEEPAVDESESATPAADESDAEEASAEEAASNESSTENSEESASESDAGE